jgi:predicted RNA-binding protein with PUA-like domain
MSDWLLKTEPSDYSFQDLLNEKKTIWTGVKNPVARKHLSSMKKNDRIVIYHTGDVKSAVGLAAVAADARTDSKDPASPLVEIEAKKTLSQPVSLQDVRKSPLFSDSPLVRIGRLSVVPLTAAQYRFLAGA